MEKVTVKTFDEYVLAAMRTYTKESHNVDYMTLGLIGETGEVANKVKKIIRDDYGKLTAERCEAILHELGDVMWYVAGLATVVNTKPIVCIEYPTLKEFDCYVSEPSNAIASDSYARAALTLCCVAGEVVNDVLCGYHISGNLGEVIVSVALLGRMIGYNIQQICQHNIGKLTARYNNNSIHGEGDGIENRG